MYIVKQRTEREYRSVDCDSSSTLKEFLDDRRKYYKKYILQQVEEDEFDSSMQMGRLVETLLFEKDEFDNRFFKSSCTKPPTGLMLNFVENLYKQTKMNTDEDGKITRDFGELAQLAYKESGYKIGLDVVLGRFKESSAEIYYKELRESTSKSIVTTQDLENAERVINDLYNTEWTREILVKESNEKHSIFNQFQIDGFEIDGLPLKMMVDRLEINHEEKYIQPYDLKVTWSVENFIYEYYLKRRSYIQAYVYHKGLQTKRSKELISQHVNNDLQGYTVRPMIFIVADSIAYHKPLLYQMTEKDLSDAYYGFEYSNRYYKGVKYAIEGIKWAKENSEWRISAENHNFNGKLLIENFIHKQNSKDE